VMFTSKKRTDFFLVMSLLTCKEFQFFMHYADVSLGMSHYSRGRNCRIYERIFVRQLLFFFLIFHIFYFLVYVIIII